MAKRFRLRKLKLDEVSMVPSGDNPPAEIVLAKAEGDKTHGGENPAPTLSDNTTKGDTAVAEISKDDLPEEVVQYIEALEDTVDEQAQALSAGDEADDLESALLEIEHEGLLDEDAVLAKADPEIRQLVEKAEARAAAAEELAKTERNERLRREYIEKAQGFPMISTDTARLGEILKAVDENLDPADAAEIHSLLAAANGALSESGLFQEIGSSVAKVAPRLESAAAEIRKANPDLTYEQAVAKALDTNPSLYEENV
jgi:hypothetical protein